jgi:hypothetical protein
MSEESHAAEEARAHLRIPLPPTLAYTIHANDASGGWPFIRVGQGEGGSQYIRPNQVPPDNSYWIVILDAHNPASKVQEWIVPGQNNTTVPANLDQYVSNPAYLFAVATNVLVNYSVPQGAFYDYLDAHGADRELQKLEQSSSHTQTGYGLFPRVSYILAGQGGPPSGRPAYEVGVFSGAALLLLSLMPLPNGQPPYSISDSYTFIK